MWFPPHYDTSDYLQPDKKKAVVNNPAPNLFQLGLNLGCDRILGYLISSYIWPE